MHYPAPGDGRLVLESTRERSSISVSEPWSIGGKNFGKVKGDAVPADEDVPCVIIVDGGEPSAYACHARKTG